MRSPGVSVCLPAYNEEATLRDAVLEASDVLRDAGFDYEILVCDDGSSDETPRILEELCKEVPHLRAFTNERNRGIYYTYEFLYRQARREFVFLNSTDCQWPMACLLDLWRLAGDHDLIVGERVQKHYGAFRAFVSSLFNAVPRLLFGVEAYDAGSVKLVRREIIERFPIVSRSPFAEAERIIRASRAGYRIGRVPVETRPRETGVAHGVSAGSLFQSALDVARVWWELRRRP